MTLNEAAAILGVTPDTLHVTISGTSYGVIEGGGLFQSDEGGHLWSAFAKGYRKRGNGGQHVADITLDDAEVLWSELDGYARLAASGGTDDDAQAGREARALAKDANRLDAQLAEAGRVLV